MAVMHYRTRDGLADYGFAIEYEADGSWRVCIVFQPIYQSHHRNMNLPHQSIDDKGRCYVDWPAKIDSLGDAKTVAALWAELIHNYQCAQKLTAANDRAVNGPRKVKRPRTGVTS